ncbi:hypothetical protein DXG03_005870 [Asterophora parasitica]|uniref:Uncharacterized protein n=1 Tax=Asterophora parasitica TaxID=117018 RepID=A0A9P7G1N3_9AGAR|nr:hypothetical protein DXG03_005870 [Asterophora parasitica]
MANSPPDAGGLNALPVSEKTPYSAKEADHDSNSVDDSKEKDSDTSVEADNANDDEEVTYLKGEPVVDSGRDVSRFVVDIRDDGDNALTFRSMVLGTVLAGLGAALCQIYLFKPVQMSVSTVFLLLVIYTFGNAWATFLPRKSWVEGTRFHGLGPVFHFINPGDFTLKEVSMLHEHRCWCSGAYAFFNQHVVSSLMASTAAGGSTAVLNFAVQRVGSLLFVDEDYFSMDLFSFTTTLTLKR